MPWPAPDAEKLTRALQSDKEEASVSGFLDESTGCKLTDQEPVGKGKAGQTT